MVPLLLPGWAIHSYAPADPGALRFWGGWGDRVEEAIRRVMDPAADPAVVLTAGSRLFRYQRDEALRLRLREAAAQAFALQRNDGSIEPAAAYLEALAAYSDLEDGADERTASGLDRLRRHSARAKLPEPPLRRIPWLYRRFCFTGVAQLAAELERELAASEDPRDLAFIPSLVWGRRGSGAVFLLEAESEVRIQLASGADAAFGCAGDAITYLGVADLQFPLYLRNGEEYQVIERRWRPGDRVKRGEYAQTPA